MNSLHASPFQGVERAVTHRLFGPL